ncbi:MAG: TolC family protein [Magnetococcales bacterium]|nr:TolC family protein [Magnetococcales bacterium]
MSNLPLSPIRVFFFIVLTAFSCFTPGMLPAQTLQDLHALLRQHPSVLALEQEEYATRQEAEGFLGLPNPTLTLGLNNLPVEKPTDFDQYLPTNKSLNFSQKIPAWTERKANKALVLEKSRLIRLKRGARLADLQTELIIALAEKVRILVSKQALDRQIELLDQLELWLKGRMESGSAVFGRFSELDIQREMIQEKIISLEGEERRWQADLKQLIGEEDTEIDLGELSLLAWTGELSRFLPVRLSEQELKLANAGIRVKEAAFDFDYGVGATYQQRQAGSNFDGRDWFSVQASASFPLWFGSNQQPKLDAAKQAAEAASNRLLDVQRRTRSQYETALANYQTADRLIQAMKKRRIRLQELQSANRSRYESGDETLEAVIRPGLEMAKLDSDLARIDADRTIAASRINGLLFMEGTDK